MTSNFYNRNASKVFAIEPTYLQDEDGNDTDEVSDWWYDDFKEDLRWVLSEDIPDFDVYDKPEYNGDRNYSGSIIGHLERSVYIQDICVATIHLKCIVRSGYYEGCNLDWEYEVTLYNGNEFENELPDVGYISYAIQDVFEEEYLDKLSKQTQSELEQLFNKMVGELESVYERVSTPLRVVGGFSDGTCVYEKINKN